MLTEQNGMHHCQWPFLGLGREVRGFSSQGQGLSQGTRVPHQVTLRWQPPERSAPCSCSFPAQGVGGQMVSAPSFRPGPEQQEIRPWRAFVTQAVHHSQIVQTGPMSTPFRIHYSLTVLLNPMKQLSATFPDKETKAQRDEGTYSRSGLIQKGGTS